MCFKCSNRAKRWQSVFRGKEAYSDCLELCWSTPQSFGQLAAHHPFLTTCFTTAPFTQCFLSRASHPECIFSTSGLGGSRASHLHRISAMINPKHPSLLVTRRRGLQFHGTSGSHLSIRHAGDSCNPPPLQIAEKQLGLFCHWCISFLWEGKLCVYESAWVCMHMSCDCYTTIISPSSVTRTPLTSNYFSFALFPSSCTGNLEDMSLFDWVYLFLKQHLPQKVEFTLNFGRCLLLFSWWCDISWTKHTASLHDRQNEYLHHTSNDHYT